MHFTREPVIETIITPKEGCKLVVRSSKNGREDYFVDAVEVVSFGNSFFYRSLERPKSFLLPVSDYEVIELKETRMVLKNASSDKSIKISPKKETATEDEKLRERSEERKKRRYRSRSRRTSTKKKETPEKEETKSDDSQSNDSQSNDSQANDSKTEDRAENKDTSSFLKKLIPPPPILIKEKLSKEKEAELPAEPKIEEEKPEEPKAKEVQEELSSKETS